jgi:hypothetical protein
MSDDAPGSDERRQGHHGHGWGGPWIGGVILIVLGVIFLLQNFGWQLPKNWWAAFILIPAAGSLMAARRNYEANGGQWTGAVVGPGIAGIVFVVMAVALFMGLEWGLFWPIILILIGGGIMARTMGRG